MTQLTDILPQRDNPFVSVSVGTVAIDGTSAFNQEGETAVYDDYIINNRYENDQHIYMMGVTSPGGFNGASVAFSQLAAPTMLWIVDWTAARYGSPPLIPDPNVSSVYADNWVLLDVHYDVRGLDIDGAGAVPRYRISGMYVYGSRNPNPIPMNDVTFPRLPMWDDNFNRVPIPDSVLAGNISTAANQNYRVRYKNPGQ